MEDRLREIIISITNRCNLKCTMCEIPLAQVDEMGTDELKQLITDAVSLRPESIVFSGGEPLLRKDIFELISFANQLKINTCLASNGTLVNNEVARRLASSGIGVVNISIEGPEDIHDTLRGKGNFKKAIEALENLSRNKIETTIATFVCRQNYASLPYIMELASRLKVTTVKFQPFSEIFLIKKSDKNSFFASLEDLNKIKLSIEEVKAMSRKYNISTNPSAYLDIIPSYLTGSWRRNNHGYCFNLWSSCPISANGDVYPCWVLSKSALGNIKTNKIYNIWNSAGHNRLRRQIIKKSCPGCLMSCYDYNFGSYNLPKAHQLKIEKLANPRFYKRHYYRLYQNATYLAGKISRRFFNFTLFYRRADPKKSDMLEEIGSAKRLLKQKLQIYKNE